MKVEFYSVIDGIEMMYPPLPATDIEMNWINGAKDFYVKTQKAGGAGASTGAHLCTGIRDFLNNAYVLTAWHDFIIHTYGDMRSFEADTTITNASLMNGRSGVEFFPPEQFGDHAILPPQTLKSVIKIPTPWRFNMPKGWGLMYAPLHYGDEARFSSVVGVIKPEVLNEINAVLFWHVLEGATFVKAGTPLCYLIPVKLDEKLDVTVRAATEKEKKFEVVRKDCAYSVWRNKAAAYAKIYKSFWGKE